MRWGVGRLCFLLSLLPALTAFAQSFDCAKATAPDEKLVCGTPALSALDEKLGAAYKAAYQRRSPSQRPDLVRRQKAWLGERHACADPKVDQAAAVACLSRAYESRLAELSAPASHSAHRFSIEGSWKVTGVDIPGAPQYHFKSADLLPEMPEVGATLVIRAGQLCITDPEPQRICYDLTADRETLSDIPGGSKRAELLKLPLDTPFLNLNLDDKAAWGVIAMPDGTLLADFPVCPTQDTCTSGFEVWKRVEAK